MLKISEESVACCRNLYTTDCLVYRHYICTNQNVQAAKFRRTVENAVDLIASAMPAFFIENLNHHPVSLTDK